MPHSSDGSTLPLSFRGLECAYSRCLRQVGWFKKSRKTRPSRVAFLFLPPNQHLRIRFFPSPPPPFPISWPAMSSPSSDTCPHSLPRSLLASIYCTPLKTPCDASRQSPCPFGVPSPILARAPTLTSTLFLVLMTGPVVCKTPTRLPRSTAHRNLWRILSSDETGDDVDEPPPEGKKRQQRPSADRLPKQQQQRQTHAFGRERPMTFSLPRSPASRDLAKLLWPPPSESSRSAVGQGSPCPFTGGW